MRVLIECYPHNDSHLKVGMHYIRARTEVTKDASNIFILPSVMNQVFKEISKFIQRLG